MSRLLENSGMLLVLVGAVLAVAGLIILIATEGTWVFYAIGWSVTAVGALVLLWVALRDRLRARKSEDLDDVGFN